MELSYFNAITILRISLFFFYKNVLAVWQELNSKNPRNANEFKQEIIWNNRFIKDRRKIFLLRSESAIATGRGRRLSLLSLQVLAARKKRNKGTCSRPTDKPVIDSLRSRRSARTRVRRTRERRQRTRERRQRTRERRHAREREDTHE